MSCVLTQGYTLDCQDSSGGVKEIHLIQKADTTLTIVSGAVTVVANATGKAFKKYEVVVETATGDEEATFNRDNGSHAVKQMVKFPINKMTTSVRNELLLLGQKPLIIVVVDNNGQGYAYGTDFGLMLTSYSAKTGAKLGDRNGYELTFEGPALTIAPTVASSVIATLETVGV